MPELWAGVDAGKLITTAYSSTTKETRLPSRKVANDETALTELFTDVLALAASREFSGPPT